MINLLIWVGRIAGLLGLLLGTTAVAARARPSAFAAATASSASIPAIKRSDASLAPTIPAIARIELRTS